MSITTILIIVAVLFAAGMLFWPKFRQLVRIRSNDAVDGMSTAIEKEKDEYKQLVAKLPKQREAVSSVMARSTQADKALADAEARVTELQGKYVTAKNANAPDTVLDKYATEWEESKADVDAKRAIAEELNSAEEEAISALEETTEALKKFADKIERDEGKAELTKALDVAAEAREQAATMKSSISRAGEASRAIDHELEKARSRNELSKGSRADREVAEFEKQQAKKSAREALDALTGGGSAPAAPASTTEDAASDGAEG